MILHDVRRCVLAGLGAALVAPLVSAQDVERGPIPDWVVPRGTPARLTIPEQAQSGDAFILVFDQQERVTDETVEAYEEIAYYVTGPAAVGTASNVSIDFDPAYESLTLHAADVLRDGETLDRLDLDAMRLLDREPGLEAAIYDGHRTAHLILEDVRTGDVVRYRYTRRGAHPALGPRVSIASSIGFGLPVGTVHRRYLWPATRKVEVRLHEGAQEGTTVARDDGFVETTWLRENVAATEFEDDMPVWVGLGPWIELSDWGSWRDVASWAVELYGDRDAAIDPEVAKQAAEIAASFATEAERVEALVRFVQDEVRYTGIELGMQSYQPTASPTVLARRFGDCKDKSLLLRDMLASIGVPSTCALVNTMFGPALPEYLPSPGAFDHVILRIDAVEGIEGPLWVDPTVSFQRGRLAERAAPLLHWALVASPEAEALERIPLAADTGFDLEVVQRIDARADEGEATVELRTTWHGALADEQRYAFADSDLGDVGDWYLEIYRESEESARMSAPLRVEDDEENNTLTTVESYRVPEFWIVERGRRETGFWAGELLNALPVIDEDRVHPLALGHPYAIAHTTIVRLPVDSSFEPETYHVENEYLRFEGSVDWDARVGELTMRVEYRTLKPVVPAADAARVESDLEEIEEHLYFGITDGGGIASPFDSMSDDDVSLLGYLLSAFAGLVGSLLLLVVVTLVVRHRDELAARVSRMPLAVSIWTCPREAVRSALGTHRRRWMYPALFVLGVASATETAMDKELLDKLTTTQLLVLLSIGGVFYIAAFAVFALVMNASASMLGGRATTRRMRIALATASLTHFVPAALFLPILAIGGLELFSASTPTLDTEAWRWPSIGFLEGLRTGAATWFCFFTLPKSVGEVAGFSAWRGLGAMVLPAAVLVLVGILAAAVLVLVGILFAVAVLFVS